MKRRIVLFTLLFGSAAAPACGSDENGGGKRGNTPDAGSTGGAPLPDAANPSPESGGTATGGTAGSGGSVASGGGGAGGATGGASPGTGGAPPPTGGATGDAAVAPEAGADADTGPVPCAGDGDCSRPNRFCDTTAHLCVECLTLFHCAQGQTCDPVSHSCKYACTNSGDCSDPRPYCDTGRRECVECLTSTNCSGGNRNVCDPDTKTCVQCLENKDCGCLLLGQTPCCTQSHQCTCGLLVCL